MTEGDRRERVRPVRYAIVEMHHTLCIDKNDPGASFDSCRVVGSACLVPMRVAIPWIQILHDSAAMRTKISCLRGILFLSTHRPSDASGFRFLAALTRRCPVAFDVLYTPEHDEFMKDIGGGERERALLAKHAVRPDQFLNCPSFVTFIRVRPHPYRSSHLLRPGQELLGDCLSFARIQLRAAADAMKCLGDGSAGCVSLVEF